MAFPVVNPASPASVESSGAPVHSARGDEGAAPQPPSVVEPSSPEVEGQSDVEDGTIPFFNVDATESERFPLGLDEAFNPLVEGLPSGLCQRLAAAVAATTTASLDWPVVDGVLQVRDVRLDHSNHVAGALGQLLGLALSEADSCARCVNSSSVVSFSSCRVVGFSLAGVGEVVCLGSCMNCLFSGVGARCSLRSSRPPAAVDFLQSFLSTFSYPASAPPTPSRRNKRVRITSPPPQSPDVIEEQVEEQVEEAVEEETVVPEALAPAPVPISYDSLLTPVLFNAPPSELFALSQEIMVRRARAVDAVEVMDADLRALSYRLAELAREAAPRGVRPGAPWNV
ncbi:hypothetical protein N7447_004666 [Penicillium robsamsonii]|uniref:uncharacterized protein n=1 Tax=Penicillium robsamsonii TaxID=1792511 RepID=UPI002549527A|nr:uncharacterized protein N7447_004666 [Penicillium robsamsonii]KAJ5827903.1 hypothetical protein N7447_004666 [Penicillium robsamsonii]